MRKSLLTLAPLKPLSTGMATSPFNEYETAKGIPSLILKTRILNEIQKSFHLA